MSRLNSTRSSVKAGALRHLWRNVREAPFFCVILLYALLDIAGLVVTVGWTVLTSAVVGGNQIGTLGLVCLYARWGLALFNEAFLVFHGHLFSNTIPGTFFFQQCVYFPLVTLTTVIVFWRTLGIGSLSWCIIISLRGLLDLVVWTGLSLFSIQLKRSENRSSIDWAVQVEELAGGAYSVPYRTVSWTGIQRPVGDTADIRMIKAIRHFVSEAFFRRVRQVETGSQVIWMNMLALMAIVLMLVRTVILLVRLNNENLPSRTLVQPCKLSTMANEMLIYVVRSYRCI